MKTFSITDVGMVRQVNQDYVYMTDNPLGPLPNLFVVADGMGGHQAGDYASKYTVEVLKRELENTSEQDVERALVSAIKTANREIIKKASEDPHLKGMGTTVVLATIVNQMMYFANVGDSRLYLINQGIVQLTKDHSLVEEMVRLGGIILDLLHHFLSVPPEAAQDLKVFPLEELLAALEQYVEEFLAVPIDTPHS